MATELLQPKVHEALFRPEETCRQRSEHWWQTTQTDVGGWSLFERHYSASSRVRTRSRDGIAGPGWVITLLTGKGDALFVWRKQDFRIDRRRGVNRAVFRNEGRVRSSVLIEEAMGIAAEEWPGVPLFTFVDPGKARSVNPGCCFRKAGWKRAGATKGGLLIFEYPGVGEKGA